VSATDESDDGDEVQNDDAEIVRVVGLVVAAINHDLQATGMPVSVVDQGTPVGSDGEPWFGHLFLMINDDRDGGGTGFVGWYRNRTAFVTELCDAVEEMILLDLRDEHGHIIEWPTCPIHDDPMSVVDLEDEHLVWRCGVVGERDHLVVLRPPSPAAERRRARKARSTGRPSGG
jgi:hypothetical protein